MDRNEPQVRVSGDHHNTAQRLGGLRVVMSLCRVTEGKCPVDHDRQTFVARCRQQCVHSSGYLRPLEQRPHEHPVQGLVVLHRSPEIDSQAATSGIADEDEATFRRKGG